jgi:hypothetical protein
VQVLDWVALELLAKALETLAVVVAVEVQLASSTLVVVVLVVAMLMVALLVLAVLESVKLGIGAHYNGTFRKN